MNDSLFTLTPNIFIILISVFAILSLILYKYTVVNTKLLRPILYISFAFEILSLFVVQNIISGLGIYTRRGWPLAVVESGTVNWVELVLSYLFYVLLSYIICTLLSKQHMIHKIK